MLNSNPTNISNLHAFFEDSDDLEELEHIVYNREELLVIANSPLSKKKPKELSYLCKLFPEVCLTKVLRMSYYEENLRVNMWFSYCKQCIYCVKHFVLVNGLFWSNSCCNKKLLFIMFTIPTLWHLFMLSLVLRKRSSYFIKIYYTTDKTIVLCFLDLSLSCMILYFALSSDSFKPFTHFFI